MNSLITEITKPLLLQALHEEHKAFYLYRHIAVQLQSLSLFGAMSYFEKESADELSHANKIRDYFNARGDKVQLPVIDEPDIEITGIKDALQAGYEAELALAKNYNDWATRIQKSGDMIGFQFILQFLEIQQKSVGEYLDWLAMFKSLGGGDVATATLDEKMGS